jgi:HEAT repeat protein
MEAKMPQISVTPQPSSLASGRGLVRRTLNALLPLLVLATAAGIWQRERLWVWYCAERLERSSDESRVAWADKLAAVGEPALPTLLALLQHDDPQVCAAAKGAMESVAGTWTKDDPRQAAFASQFFDAEPRFSTPGRGAALEMLPTLLASATPEMNQRARSMVANAAKSDALDLRVQAVAAAMRQEVECLDAIVPLLGDAAPEVRRAAVLALGPARENGGVADDELLRCLHDSDPEVRRLCEMGLRSRGRTPRDIRLGRRYTAPDPAERQKLLIDLADEDELDVTVWLERLTADPDPAVRAGAARVAVDRGTDLLGRLEQMSQSDPDGTVRRIAGFYHRKLLAMK